MIRPKGKRASVGPGKGELRPSALAPDWVWAAKNEIIIYCAAWYGE
jgi:hypothetical protein